MKNKVLFGDCKKVLPTIDENSIDSIVTDPPYEISYMNKGFDKTGIAFDVEMWTQCLNVLKPGGYLLAFGAPRTYHRLTCAIEDAGFEIRDCILWAYLTGFPHNMDLGKATKDDRFKGFGTALKNTYEPIVVARKPISESSLTKNVKKWGTGGYNIDACRIGTEGKWPTNMIIEDAEQAGAMSRICYIPKASKSEKEFGLEHRDSERVNDGRKKDINNPYQRGTTERKNIHPTVKPIELMEYLITLVTPINGIVLDHFVGSGTTCIAARKCGCSYLGIELDEKYAKLAEDRINAYCSDMNGILDYSEQIN